MLRGGENRAEGRDEGQGRRDLVLLQGVDGARSWDLASMAEELPRAFGTELVACKAGDESGHSNEEKQEVLRRR